MGAESLKVLRGLASGLESAVAGAQHAGGLVLASVPRWEEQAAALREAIADCDRLDALERFVTKERGLVLHTGDHGGGKYAGLYFLGDLCPLREALDRLRTAGEKS